MKFTKYLLTAIFLLSIINCSSSSKATTENINVAANANTANATTENAAVETAAQKTDEPETFLKDLYKTHDKNNGAIVQGNDRAILDKYFDKNLADLIWKDMTTNRDGVGVIDFDIFYNAQDAEIKNLSVGDAKISGGKAVVDVSFDNFGKKNLISYYLTKEKSSWKISNINYGTNENLLKYFKEANQNTSSTNSGEFEGKYQIGETTCTVKPVKMAFEVRWEKGSGVEMFFSEGEANDKFIFASDPETGKANVFSFDDENYNSGIFYRADGKEFSIKRIN